MMVYLFGFFLTPHTPSHSRFLIAHFSRFFNLLTDDVHLQFQSIFGSQWLGWRCSTKEWVSYCKRIIHPSKIHSHTFMTRQMERTVRSLSFSFDFISLCMKICGGCALLCLMAPSILIWSPSGPGSGRTNKST